jgi:2-keto-4-pentenoate hydratase/2-oxohepta-3-ene-1,7-dioic acid hydratase in catechol pathway
MKLYTFEIGGVARLGAGQGDRIVDLALAHEARVRSSGRVEAPLPADMAAFVRAGDAGLRAARQALEHATVRPDGAFVHDPAAVKLRAPIARPGKILCSGINYHGHLQENPKAKLPEEPFFFSKVPSAVIGPGDPIVLPARSRQVDYEVELAVVIGQPLARAAESAVPGAIFGYTILHDVSARDVQFKDNQITLGKNFDGFCPLGPCLVTADEIPRPETLRLRTLLNGEVMQDSTNADWVFPLPRLLSALSHVMTLEPGDVVSTGTPRGVGTFRDPQVFLKAGDRVVLEIDGIGRLENPVVGA